MGVFEDLTGQKFGRITIESFAGRKKKRSLWNCICECGIKKVIRGDHLKSGLIVSCGCFFKEGQKNGYNRKHSMAGTPEYKTWLHMKERCLNPSVKEYHNYGGRGIGICKEWADSFEPFFTYIGKRPSPDHSIDRIDNDGNYKPGNVRWATRREQMNNYRKNHRLTYKGETMTLAEWGRRLGVNGQALGDRIRRGWTPEDTIEKPIRNMNRWKNKAA